MRFKAFLDQGTSQNVVVDLQNALGANHFKYEDPDKTDIHLCSEVTVLEATGIKFEYVFLLTQSTSWFFYLKATHILLIRLLNRMRQQLCTFLPLLAAYLRSQNIELQALPAGHSKNTSTSVSISTSRDTMYTYF
jgi:hypothetical protein